MDTIKNFILGRVCSQPINLCSTPCVVRVAGHKTTKKRDAIASWGNAQAHIANKDREAMAMAKDSGGAAYVWTDGRRTEYALEGSGRIITGNGVAYASAGRSAAMAYSVKAEKKSRNNKVYDIRAKQPRYVEESMCSEPLYLERPRYMKTRYIIYQ